VVFIVVSGWLLRLENFEPSFIFVVAPIISTFLTLLALLSPSENLCAFAIFVFGIRQGRLRLEDLNAMM
jgi:hypothetical protein